MAREIIDIKDTTKGTTSPIAVGVWFVVFVILNILIKDDFLILFLLSIGSWFICDMLFKYTPRMVYITILYVMEAPELTPSHPDKGYYHNLEDIKGINEVIDFED